MGKVLFASTLVSSSVLVLGAHAAGDGRTPGTPVLIHASHVGGSSSDEARDVFVDEEGCAYVVGSTRSFDFPGVEPRSVERGRDALVFKLSPDGREVLWALCLGGRGDDEATTLAVSPTGEVYVSGTTASHDFPTTRNAHDRRLDGGVDGFVARLSPDGNLRWATLLGGSAEEEVAGLALSASGQVTVAGTTRSHDFPLSAGAYRAVAGGARDAFVTRLGENGEDLVFSCTVGGGEDDEVRALAVDPEGACYLAGRTVSHDFPATLAAVDRERCGVDGFVLKLSGGGRALLWASFLGGSGQDEALGLAVDGERRVLVAGWTQSLDFPFTVGVPGGRKDGFVVAFSSTGNALAYAVPLGGGSADEACDVSVDAAGRAWVTGRTRSADFPLARGAQRSTLGGVADGFVCELSPRGELGFTSLLGGAGEDALCGVHTDAAGRSLLLGGFALDVSRSERGPLAGPRRGPADVYLVRLDLRAAQPTTPMQAGLGF